MNGSLVEFENRENSEYLGCRSRLTKMMDSRNLNKKVGFRNKASLTIYILRLECAS